MVEQMLGRERGRDYGRAAPESVHHPMMNAGVQYSTAVYPEKQPTLFLLMSAASLADSSSFSLFPASSARAWQRSASAVASWS